MTGIDAEGGMQTMDGRVTLPSAWVDRLLPGSLLAAGLIAPSWIARARQRGVRTVQYRMEPSFMWLNALPTAEGAIKAALGESGYTLSGRPLAILGCGRVGTVLALKLAALGARVRVLDRSRERRAMAEAFGLCTHPLRLEAVNGVDGLFNTIPAPVLDESWLRTTDPAWIIDLASDPGGLSADVRPTWQHHPRYRHLLGLPGLTAPIRAAEIIWQTLCLALEEETSNGTTVGNSSGSRYGGFSL
jgi:dipicolinate synthase subunit A